MNSNILEDIYLSEPDFPIVKSNYVVISGCSGGGKSTLLSELEARGYSVVPEAGRQIVKEQVAIEGDALPWIDVKKFSELVLSRYLFQFNSQRKSEKFIFFDRGIIDSIQTNLSQPKYFGRAGRNFRYNRLVFLVPPWEEIFGQDRERKHDFDSANKEYQQLLIQYKAFGYETVLIPKMSIKERGDFILDKLGVSADKIGPRFLVRQAKRLLEWNREKLTCHSHLCVEDLKELFDPEFVVIANGKKYNANHENYYEFLNQFRSNIDMIDYEVEQYFDAESAVIIPMRAILRRVQGKEEVFVAILLLKFNYLGKIIHWEEVYSLL